MIALSRIPFWGWYLFSVAFSYWVWNPYFSVGQVLGTDLGIQYKALVLVLTFIISSLYILEGMRTINLFGLFLFVALFGCLFWVFAKFDLHTVNSMQWWIQWITGLLLAIAVQGGRIRRALTGRLSVVDDDDPHHS